MKKNYLYNFIKSEKFFLTLLIINIIFFYYFRVSFAEDKWYSIFGLFICHLSIFYILSKNTSKKFFSLVIFVYIFYFLLEASYTVGIYYNGKAFAEEFYYHIRLDTIYSGFLEHYVKIIYFFLFLLLSLTSFLLRKLQGISSNLWKYLIGVFFLGLVVSPSAQSFFLNTSFQEIVSDEVVDLSIFSEILVKTPTIVTRPTQKKNLILIYVESLNARFFDESIFPDLLPRLKEIRENSVDFVDLKPGIGSGWTIGGIVASQCGFPLSDQSDNTGNSLGFLPTFMPKAKCLGDMLSAEGYRLVYMGGADLRFAGKGAFLKEHGYSELIGRDALVATLLDKTYKSSWGPYDDTLFENAYKKFNDLNGGEKPFVLTLLTLDTHAPTGIKSPSCSNYKNFFNRILSSYHCTDNLLSQFVERIRLSPFSEDTVIVVVADHLAMRNTASDLLEKSTLSDNLTFFVNYHDGRHEKIERSGLQYDIAPTVLESIGYKLGGNIGLGKSLLSGDGYLVEKFGPDKWREHKNELLALAKRQWETDYVLDGSGVNFDLTKMRLNIAGHDFDLRSEGFSMLPATVLFIVDKVDFKIEKMLSVPSHQKDRSQFLQNKLKESPGKIFITFGPPESFLDFEGVNFSGNVILYGTTDGTFIQEPISTTAKIKYDDLKKL